MRIDEWAKTISLHIASSSIKISGVVDFVLSCAIRKSLLKQIRNIGNFKLWIIYGAKGAVGSL